MASTSLSQALDLDPKEMSCQNFFLHVALYLLCSVWPEVFFFSAYFDTLDLRFLCAINLLHPSCNGNGAVLGAVLGSSVARGWIAQQRLVLPGPGVVPPVPAALGHCKQAASSCHGPLEEVLLLQIELQVGWGFCFSVIWHRACDPTSAALCAKVNVMKAAVSYFFANDCAVFAHSSKNIWFLTVLYVLHSTLSLQPFWKKNHFLF